MGSAVIRGGFDTYAGSVFPNRSHGGADYLRLKSGQQLAFIYVKNPVPRGATVLSATLRVKVRGSSSGTRTLTCRRVDETWKASKLTWNNMPGVTGGSQPTATIGTVSNGDTIEFDVTTHLQTVVNGSSHYGWRIETDATTTHKLYAFNAGVNKPTLFVTWSDRPDTPTTLVPSSGSVSVDKPVVQFDYSDITGDDLVAVQVQVDPSQNASAPAWDSGEVATEVPELDLSSTTYPGLADGATTSWRVRVKDSGGLWSLWSDWATFSRDVKGTLTIDNPGAPPNDFVNEPSPPILWTLTGETQRAYRVRITDADDRTKLRYDSGVVKSSTTAHDLPAKWRGRRVLVDDRTYSVNVRVWDTKDRVATPGDPLFVAAWRDFTMDDDLTVAAPTLAVEQVGISPWVDLTFTRATAPDSWVVRRDGKVVESGIDPDDVFVSGTTYVWRDKGATPQESHTYTVQAVVNRKASGKSNTATVTTSPVGIWLLDPRRDLDVLVLGQESGSWGMADQATTYTPIGSDTAVRIVTGMRGYEGSITGTLMDAYGRTSKAEITSLYRIKERPAEVYQLVAADVSIPVYLGDITIAPSPLSQDTNPVHSVSFSFWQAGDLSFDARF